MLLSHGTIQVKERHSLLVFESNQCFAPSGQLADDLVFEILKEKLNSKQCKNQGFVIDGFLETYEQAKLIFSGEFHPLTYLLCEV